MVDLPEDEKEDELPELNSVVPLGHDVQPVVATHKSLEPVSSTTSKFCALFGCERDQI